MKIFMLEDNPGYALYIMELLKLDKGSNCEITWIDRFKLVTKEIRSIDFDVILLDLSLPDSDGIETVKKIKKLFPKTPVIVLSATEDEVLIKQVIQKGVDDFLEKGGINIKYLLNTIKFSIERKKFQKSLEESEKRLKTLIDKNSDGIVVVDGEGIVKYLNPSAEKLFSRTKKELLDQKFGFPISINENTEISLIGKGGEIKTVEMRISEINWEDKPCFLASLRDISIRKEFERKNLEYSEKLKQLNENKDTFFSIIAHDLRSPFQALLNLTEMMADEHENFTIRDYTTFSLSLNKSAVNISQLLGNLLEWAQMQRGSINYAPEDLDLNLLIEKNIEILFERAIQKGIIMKNEVDGNQIVVADEKMVDTILRNLLSNAIKFTKRGGAVTLKAVENGSGMLNISVSDTGVGISAERLEKLFKINEKIGTKGTDDEPTSGLGLLLCKEFVEKNGGEIWVESTIGKGSKFCFTLKISADQNEK